VSPVALKAAVQANNAFAVALFARLREPGKAEDMLTSPLSAALALTMASAGAKGQTRSEMAKALQFGASSAETIFAGQNALSQALLLRGPASLAATPQRTSDQNVPLSANDYQLQLVTSIWGQTDYPWQAPFLKTLAEAYGTGLNRLDFRSQSERARQTINDWVSAGTSHKISDLIPAGALDDSTRLVLVNALHLRFPWANLSVAISYRSVACTT
jgi:serpin B